MICVDISHTVIRDFPKVVSGIQKGGWKLSLHVLLILPALRTNPCPPSNDSLYQIPPFLVPLFAHTCYLCTCCGHCVSSMLSGETWLEHRAPGHTGDYLACSQVLGWLLEKTTAKVGPGGLRGTLEQVELGAKRSFARNHQLPLKSVRIEVRFY